MAAQLDLDLTSSQHERLLQLDALDEFRMQALLHRGNPTIEEGLSW